MPKPPIPENEAERLKALLEKEILDTLPEVTFDNIVKLAASICGTKFSAISLIDSERQWFKAKFGFDAESTPRDVSFCGHVILGKETVEVMNANSDDRFKDNPSVTGDPKLKFYAGVPLIDENGYALGTLCVFDPQSRVLEEFQRTSLEALARKVVALMNERK